MLSCEACEMIIVDALYQSLAATENQQLKSHLQQCASCRALMDEMLAATEQLRRHDDAAEGSMTELANNRPMDELWENLQAPLNAIDADRYHSAIKKRFSTRIVSALAVAASVVLFVAAIVPALTNNSPVTDTELAQLIHPELISYLSRAEVMLMMVANAESEGITVIPMRNSFARDMALEANVLSTSMEDRINTGQHRLLSDIEYLLLQIANLDESNMADGVALLQQYLEQNSVLFKIRLLEMRNQESVI